MYVKGSRRLLEDPKSILLIQLGDIGDVVLTLPCIKALGENFPEAQIVVAVLEKALDLLEDCPGVSEVIGISKQKRSLLEELGFQKAFWPRLRRHRFDLAFDLRTGTRGGILAFLSGARQRIGFYAHDGKLWRNRIFTHLLNRDYEPTQHVAQYYLNLLQAYDISTDCIRPELTISPEKHDQATMLLQRTGVPLRKIIIIQPFSLWKYKEWAAEKYAHLIDWLQRTYNVAVLVTGSADQKERAEKIIARCPQQVFNLAGQTSIGVLPAVLKKGSLFIGVDSAGLHLAAAVGTPTIAIFGPSSPISWAPLGQRHMVVTKGLPCQPCRRKGCEDSEVSRCMQELTVEEVAVAVARQMDQLTKSSYQ